MLSSKLLIKPVLRIIQLISLDNQGKRLLFSHSDVQKQLIRLINKCNDLSCLEYIIYTLGQISSVDSLKRELISNEIIEVCVGLLRSNKYIDNEIIL